MDVGLNVAVQPAVVEAVKCPYSQFLPYATVLPREAAVMMEEIKQGFQEVIAKRKFGPGLSYWCETLAT